MKGFTMDRWVKGIRKTATPHLKDDGTEVYRLFADGERYMVDFAPDLRMAGWEQFDTGQDAAFYGVWVNRRERMTLEFAEGDWTLCLFPDRATYRAAIGRLIAFHQEGWVARAVTPGGGYDRPDGTRGDRVVEYRQDRKALFLDPIDNEGR